MIYYQGVKDIYMHPLSSIFAPPWETFKSQVTPFIGLLGNFQVISFTCISFFLWVNNFFQYRPHPLATLGTESVRERGRENSDIADNGFELT